MLGQLNPPARYLLGAGPSPVEPSVLAAMGKPLLGQADPEFHRIMEATRDGLRQVLRTFQRLTFPLAGGASTAMEAALVNLIEPNDPVVVGVSGESGVRMAEAARRVGGRVTEVSAPWGRPVSSDELASAAQRRGAKLVGIVHADSSTGVRQPVEELRPALGEDRLLVVDATVSLGGVPVEVDAWGIDTCYSMSEGCLGVPPGIAPITFSPRAEAAVSARSTPVRSWSMDLKHLRAAFDGSDSAQASLPVSMIYGLHEGLRLVLREGLQPRWQRHAEAGRFLQESLEEMGFDILSPRPFRLPQLTVALLPAGVDDDLREVLLRDYDIEVSEGSGQLAGKTWRIGLMGFGARREHALRLLQALRALLSLPGRSRRR